MLWHSITHLLYRIGIYSEGSGDNIKGIDGWLILPLLYLFVIIITSFISITSNVILLSSPNVWHVLNTEGSNFYSESWLVFFTFIFSSKIILLIFSAYTLYLFCKKSYRLPSMMINLINLR